MGREYKFYVIVIALQKLQKQANANNFIHDFCNSLALP